MTANGVFGAAAVRVVVRVESAADCLLLTLLQSSVESNAWQLLVKLIRILATQRCIVQLTAVASGVTGLPPAAQVVVVVFDLAPTQSTHLRSMVALSARLTKVQSTRQKCAMNNRAQLIAKARGVPGQRALLLVALRANKHTPSRSQRPPVTVAWSAVGPAVHSLTVMWSPETAAPCRKPVQMTARARGLHGTHVPPRVVVVWRARRLW